ncbi:hypothetical protein [Leptospira biflexa]|uniref:hypothetical protein n=1 Tax=Leptospira biflexa TaxID=172 RepID=UPI0002DA4D6E|nr:hypothetical protein [Leptospira biflexa]
MIILKKVDREMGKIKPWILVLLEFNYPYQNKKILLEYGINSRASEKSASDYRREDTNKPSV